MRQKPETLLGLSVLTKQIPVKIIWQTGSGFFACKSPAICRYCRSHHSESPFGVIPAGHRHFMAGPRATDAYEPRQIRKEAAISKAGCVAGFPAFPVLAAHFCKPLAIPAGRCFIHPLMPSLNGINPR